MEATEIIEKIKNMKIDKEVSFSKLPKEIQKELLESPEDTLNCFMIAKEKIIRIKDLPDKYRVVVKDLRDEHVGKFIKLTGNLTKVDVIKPLILSAKFECPSCGNLIKMVQYDEIFRTPKRCGCGRKGNFRMISQERTNSQKIDIAENGLTKGFELPVVLTHDLVDDKYFKIMEDMLLLEITCYVKVRPMKKFHTKINVCEWIVKPNYIEVKK